jgi:hypothetical protein
MKLTPPPNGGNRHATLESLVLVAAALLPLLTTAQVLPSDAAPRCAIPASRFSSWFDTGTVTLDGAVKPANSLTFIDQPNCPFYEWSEQMFLWLTSVAPPEAGGGRTFNSQPFFDVLPPDANNARALVSHSSPSIKLQVRNSQVGPNNLPIVFDKKGRMLEVLPPEFGPNGAPLVALSPGKAAEVGRLRLAQSGKPLFFDLRGKQIAPNFALSTKKASTVDTLPLPAVRKFLIDNRTVFLDQTGKVVDVEQGQAGGNSVLLSQRGSLVYYGVHVNDAFAYFLTGAKNGSISPMPTKFPTAQSDLDKVAAFAAQHGKTLSRPEALAIELKTAWIEAAGLDTSKFLTMTATIPTYDTSDATKWTSTGSRVALLAMVGMHVVGSTKGHPEMIWATFEHVDNAPPAAYTYVNTSNQVVTVPQSTAGSWLFSTNGSTGPFNVERMSYVSPNIVASDKNTIGASDTLRWKAWGAASDVSPNPIAGSAALSNSDVISSNNSVIGQLVPGDVRRNYIMTGATWTIGGAAPGVNNQVGTSQLANSTMETYQQSLDTLHRSDNNCFACHRSNTTGVSRIFKSITPLSLAPKTP